MHWLLGVEALLAAVCSADQLRGEQALTAGCPPWWGSKAQAFLHTDAPHRELLHTGSEASHMTESCYKVSFLWFLAEFSISFTDTAMKFVSKVLVF